MRRTKVKHLRERLALWVAPWLKPGMVADVANVKQVLNAVIDDHQAVNQFGNDVNLYRATSNTIPSDVGLRIGRRIGGEAK